MDEKLFREILEIESTSGRERRLSEWLMTRLEAPSVEAFEVGDGTQNLLLRWGEPRIVYCTHMDTVPPYIPPREEGGVVYGRGSCDAKGQLFAMYSACKELEARGRDGFALLLLSGEETGSWGAKAFDRTGFRAPYLVIGEPTENVPVNAAKGTKGYELTFTGKPFHSGYPEMGVSAVQRFIDFMNGLAAAGFPQDPVLGGTTWNVGRLQSDNPQNVLSPALTCRLFFRTTFASDGAVVAWMRRPVEGLAVKEIGGDTPSEYFVPEGFTGAPVAFGSDAPHLHGFRHKIICGPGSIKVAHRDDEQVRLEDIRTAIENYLKIYESCH